MGFANNIAFTRVQTFLSVVHNVVQSVGTHWRPESRSRLLHGANCDSWTLKFTNSASVSSIDSDDHDMAIHWDVNPSWALAYASRALIPHITPIALASVIPRILIAVLDNPAWHKFHQHSSKVVRQMTFWDDHASGSPYPEVSSCQQLSSATRPPQATPGVCQRAGRGSRVHSLELLGNFTRWSREPAETSKSSNQGTSDTKLFQQHLSSSACCLRCI